MVTRTATALMARHEGGLPAPLLNHVPHVFGVAPEKQMVRSDAGRIVAVVQHIQSGRDRTVVEFPGQAVSLDPSLSTTPALKLAVAFGGRSCPEPAAIRLLDLGPESVYDRSEYLLHNRSIAYMPDTIPVET